MIPSEIPTPRRATELRVNSVLEALQECEETYFITLTTRRSYSRQTLSRAVSEWIHRLNRALFGMHYTRRGVRMTVYVTHEANTVQGLHAHVLVGLPNDWRELKANAPLASFDELARRIWCSLETDRRAVGQDVRAVFNLSGAAGYVHKTIGDLNDLDRLDVTNLYIS